MSSELQILLVEDNEHLRAEMLDFLNRPGWVACAVGSGVEVDQHLVQNTPDVVLLDVNLPHEDGFSITARLRATYPDIGIVLLTARVHPADRAMGYKAGADVYLTKPTHTGELLAVLNNLGRRVKPVEVIQYFTLDRIVGRLFTPDGRNCTLSRGELRLMEMLALSAGKEVEFDQMHFVLNALANKDLTKASLATSISRLRSKFKSELEVDDLIAASRGVGYRLTVPMQLR
ncbi:response regulator transcription factor [Limnobacter sp.]|uniref:response regulator transcription factor n=1 Tax=Limnobacter sp. TaxID=2003368 RepID=UPI0027BAEC4D|nr:response regulator transcription factor [Limnobacter sp.]